MHLMASFPYCIASKICSAFLNLQLIFNLDFRYFSNWWDAGYATLRYSVLTVYYSFDPVWLPTTGTLWFSNFLINTCFRFYTKAKVILLKLFYE